MKYNGWTNWQTWVFNLNYNEDPRIVDIIEGIYDEDERLEDMITDIGKGMEEAFLYDMPDSTGMWRDFMIDAYKDVSFTKLAEAYLADYIESLKVEEE